MHFEPQRRARGAQKIGEILVKHGAGRSLSDLAPQLATYVLEVIYGEIYQASTLDSRTRKLSPSQPWQLSEPPPRSYEPHRRSPEVRRRAEELIEIMMQLVPYVGVAAAINEVAACRDVFASADKR